MAAPALTAAGSLTFFAVGAAANLVASNKPLEARTWLPGGGFIGVLNGRSATPTPPQAPSSVPPAAATPAASPGNSVAVGGQTDKPAPPTPFGLFPKHKPTKLPGPPKPYDPSSSP